MFGDRRWLKPMPKKTNERETASLLRPVETQRASEAIYEQIKTLIVQGQLKPGDRLPSERSLMEVMGRSRPTVREALRMLEREGFIRTVPGGSGAVVQQLSTDIVAQSLDTMLQVGQVSLTELGEFRLHNDVAVARWAAQRRTQSDINALSACLDKMERHIQEKDWESFVGLDPEFHCLLAYAGKNTVAAVMSQVLSQLSNPITLKRFANQPERDTEKQILNIWDMHCRIFEAVRDGYPQKAEEAMAFHIQDFVNDNC